VPPLAVLVLVLVAPAHAAPSTVPPQSLAGSGTATWAQQPRPGESAEPTDATGTVVFEEERTRRRIEMRVDGTPSFPLADNDTRKITVPVTVVAAERTAASCRPGTTGTIDLLARTGREVRVNMFDCGFRNGYLDGHAGTVVDLKLTPPADGARPWPLRFEFTVRTAGAGGVDVPDPLKISFSMPERYGQAGRDGIVDPATDGEAADPRGGFPVRLGFHPCPSSGVSVRIDGRREPLTDREADSCRVVTRLPEGDHEVAAAGGRFEGERTIRVQDWLVIGLGDSIGSGEGNPDLPEGDGRSVARWQDRRCHRSAKSYQARAARALENHDDQTSVTFVHLACSGAAISEGVTGGYGGIVNPGALAPLNAQLDEALDLVGGRDVDAVILSIGANDMRFGDILLFCVKHQECQDTEYRDGLLLRDWMPARFASGRPDYAQLDTRLGSIESDRVYVVQYPDPLREADGRTFCDEILDSGLRAIRADEARWTFESFLLPLNAAIQATSRFYGWNVVSGAQEKFAEHGYCAPDGDRWMVQLLESRHDQGDNNGTMHPTARGHLELAKFVRRELLADLYDKGRPRRPR
jgi:hypothetical protein